MVLFIVVRYVIEQAIMVVAMVEVMVIMVVMTMHPFNEYLELI